MSPSHVVIIHQSDAGLQRLPSYHEFKPGVTNLELHLVAKMQKNYSEIETWGNPSICGQLIRGLPLVSKTGDKT